jgi:hypothetical protein
VLLVELTRPAEEGIEAAAIRKQSRYLQLASNNNDNTKPWQLVKSTKSFQSVVPSRREQALCDFLFTRDLSPSFTKKSLF